MKNIYKTLAMGLVSLSLVGCADLDTEPQGNTITSDQKSQVVDNDPSKLSASVAGITSMFSIYGNTSGYHFDFGYPFIMLDTDSRGIDLVGLDIGYNWFNYPMALTDYTTTHAFNSTYWSTLYNQIYTTNTVAATIDPETEESTSQFYLAQALAIRAFDYFYLAQMYQQTYYGNQDKPCVPLILDTNANDVAANGAPRSSVEEVYAQIMTDLNNAVELLRKSTKVRDDRRYVNLPVALGLRARVELVMHDWAAAKADAQEAISLTDAAPISIKEASKPGFWAMTEGDWMWGISVAETDRVVTSGIVNWPSHMGSLNYGYASVGAWRLINKSLYNQIGENDARKGWFLNANKTSANLTAKQQAYCTDYKMPAYTQVKFGCYNDELGTSTNANDIPLMRVEEMYLTLAEATAMSGDPATGAQILQSFVQTYRDPSYTCTASTAETVQNAVWIQRRIELWGEGQSYFDLMRLKKGIDRRGAGFPSSYVFNIADGDPILIYQIPNAEIQGNKQITEDDNNPMPTTPTPVKE